jgi:FkbM family methyltransferase
VSLSARMSQDWSDPAQVAGGSPLHKIARRILPLETRWQLAEQAFQAKTQLRLAKNLARELGWSAVAKIRLAQLSRNLTQSRRLTRMRLPGYAHPVYYREGTSDALVIEQVFARKEYECVQAEPMVRSIIDCGANVGYTAFYLLHHYPFARIAIVEPDSENLAVCRKNLAPFGDRVTMIQAGIWDAAGPMCLDRQGDAWAFVARPAQPHETPEFNAVTIGDVMTQAGFSHVDILKVDIEGAEEVAFRNQPRWLANVKTLVVELHGPACENSVVDSLRAFDYDRSTNGELTIFRSLRPKGLGL